jgi:hypothetical protein
MSQQRMQTRKLDPVVYAEVYENVTPTVRAALTALGLRNGVFHMEVFRNAQTGEVWFSECAARRGGGLTHEEIAFKFGIDLGAAALRLAAGLTAQIAVDVRPGFVGATFLPQREGILLSCPTAQDVTERPSVAYARIELPAGFHMRGTVTDTIVRVGQVMLHSETLDGLRSAGAHVVEWFTEKMVVLPTTLSPAELRGLQLVAA